jgi:hypothetical protein
VKWLAGGVLFVLLATANGAGYRYGVSDQAFYIPAVNRILTPAAFPRDAPLIDAQGRLILTDDLLAGAARLTGLSLDILFFLAYLLSLGLIWTAVVLIGQSVYASPWLIAAFGAAVTLRHRIPRTSANSLEPYFHPRVFAFGLGALAIAAVLRRRFWTAAVLVGSAALVHLTTALWFAIVVGVALMVLDPRWRRAGLWIGGAAVVIAGAALISPAIRASVAPMDERWLLAVAAKDSLFASQWPLWAWMANLGFLALLWWAHRRRIAHGIARPEETAVVWGAAALVVLFIATMPAVIARLAVPVQFQISRVFWIVDFLAIAMLIGVARRQRAAILVAAVLVAVSAARGVYIMTVERPDRALFAIGLERSPWHEAMDWLRDQPLDTHVLADPGHAWKYGTSVRVSAERDVFLEDVKDSAIAIYSRDVAMRYLERTEAIGDFGALDAHRARELAAKYDLDYLVAESDLELPIVFRNERFRVYVLQSDAEGAEDAEPDNRKDR